MRERRKLHGVLLDHEVASDERCLECDASCCRGFPSVPLSPEEYARLERLGASRLMYTLNGRHFLVIEQGCEFLDGNRCSIYADRPLVCRLFTCREDG